MLFSAQADRMHLFSSEVPKNFVELPEDIKPEDLACEDVSMCESPCLTAGEFNLLFNAPRNNIGQILPPDINSDIAQLSKICKTTLENAAKANGFNSTIRRDPFQMRPDQGKPEWGV